VARLWEKSMGDHSYLCFTDLQWDVSNCKIWSCGKNFRIVLASSFVADTQSVKSIRISTTVSFWTPLSNHGVGFFSTQLPLL